MSGPDRIRRILSVIAHQFSYQELQNRLGVSPTTINAARKYATFNETMENERGMKITMGDERMNEKNDKEPKDSEKNNGG
ncbi:unnamed protein product [Rhizophagus irregularis]|uniref:Uncharacterized protein n=1 Tax=Rhizophagus irregularis TaxID=588596 RepID=A0A915ZKM1_9GLOM|nr:unnamed protein product [Rhizophagus irregularis]CAB5380995.1 unnamed protein product [Rhizophagus irregularis]